MKEMTQEERLNDLVEAFKADYDETVRRTVSLRAKSSARSGDLPTPKDTEGKRRLLRSLMNIRMPGQMDARVIGIQDEYLKERIRENGIVKLSDIPVLADQGCSHPFAEKLSIWQGDITRLAVDAIVNAANSQMLGCFVPLHACIDNCIHTFAGIQLRAECGRRMAEFRSKYGPDYEQPTAVPMLTDGYNLPAKKVAHVVGPIVGGSLTEALEQDLAACYKNTLDLCLENGLRSVAFCCISTGVFCFPNKRAAEIAVKTVTAWLAEHPDAVERVIFNVFKDEDKAYYDETVRRTVSQDGGPYESELQ